MFLHLAKAHAHSTYDALPVSLSSVPVSIYLVPPAHAY